jgi:hypothetical protein
MANSIEVNVHWEPVLNKDGTPYMFPKGSSEFSCEKYTKPVVYRWRIGAAGGTGKDAVYIGEAEDLPRRVQRVLTPAKNKREGDTNRRLHELFEAALTSGTKVHLEVAQFEPFLFNGVRFSVEDLRNSFKRIAVENLFLAVAQTPDLDLLNKYVDSTEKEFTKAFMKLSPAERKRILERAQSMIGPSGKDDGQC